MTCCPVTIKAVHSGYVKKSVDLYISGTGPKGIVFVPDIWGNHPNAYQLCDVLAAQGYTVIMPDYFRGKPWGIDDTPGSGEQWGAFFARISSFEGFVADVEYAASTLRRMGISSIGSVGLCWGAKVSLIAQSRGIVGPVASAHPSFLDVSDGERATAPVCLLPTKEDPPLLDVKAALATKPFAAKNVFQRFDDMSHGFLGARGGVATAANYNDEAIHKRASEALGIIVSFLRDTM